MPQCQDCFLEEHLPPVAFGQGVCWSMARNHIMKEDWGLEHCVPWLDREGIQRCQGLVIEQRFRQHFKSRFETVGICCIVCYISSNPLLAPSRKPQNPNVLSFPGTGFTKPHNLIDPKPKTLLPEGAILDSSKIPGTIVRVRAEHRAFDDRRVLYGPLLLWSGFRV